MSRTTVIVALFAWHLFAVGLSSIPGPTEPSGSGISELPAPWVSRTVGPVLDSIEGARNAGFAPVWRMLSPVRRLTGAYTRLIGLEQRWNMFQEPPEDDQYIHMRYYVATGARSVVRVDRELVFPAEREDRFAWVNWTNHEEKAVRNARQAFGKALSGLQNVNRVSDLPPQLAPVLRHYAARHRKRLLATESLLRAELWLGWARVPPPGQDQAETTSRRLEVLQDYLDDPRTAWTAVGNYPPLGWTERESDIDWTLAYYEAWP